MTAFDAPTPQSGEGPAVASGGPPKDHDYEPSDSDSSASIERAQIRAEIDERDARFAALRVALVSRGYRLDIITGVEGGAAYLVRHWGLGRELDNITSVDAILTQIGGAA